MNSKEPRSKLWAPAQFFVLPRLSCKKQTIKNNGVRVHRGNRRNHFYGFFLIFLRILRFWRPFHPHFSKFEKAVISTMIPGILKTFFKFLNLGTGFVISTENGYRGNHRSNNVRFSKINNSLISFKTPTRAGLVKY
jgi:hypothetical protein